MKGQSPIADNDKWQAVLNCDKRFDGLFLYGVRTTGIFCRPSCKSKVPDRGNVLFFDSSAAAMEAGFRPCKRCCPDKESFEPERELVERARKLFDSGFESPGGMNSAAKQLGVSMSYLTRLFRKQLGVTPVRYVAGLRIDKAAELLAGTDKDILDIAYEAGFRSLSSFYRSFRGMTGCTPKKYRKEGGKKDAGTFL
ncbi:MAG TPA: Ada metal-binding domain-containing protein [Clostridia bacterium]|nr:Ada metal-binding domain-containing protein [Clostridia bacterium]